MPNNEGRETHLRLVGNRGGDDRKTPVEVLRFRQLEAGIFEHCDDPRVFVVGLRNLLDEDSFIWLPLPQLADLLQLLMLVAAQLATQHDLPDSTRVELLRLTAKLAYIATHSEPDDDRVF